MFELPSLVLGVVVTEVLLDMETQVQEWLVLISPAAVWCPDPLNYFLVCPCSALQWVVVGLDHHHHEPQHGQVPSPLAVLPILGTGWGGYLV